MRRPRVGFRAFLLINTLASLVAATLAIRARTDSFRFAQDHALLAHQVRVRRAWNDAHNRDAALTWEQKAPSLVSRQWAAGCDLRILPPVRSEEKRPTNGRRIVLLD